MLFTDKVSYPFSFLWLILQEYSRSINIFKAQIWRCVLHVYCMQKGSNWKHANEETHLPLCSAASGKTNNAMPVNKTTNVGILCSYSLWKSKVIHPTTSHCGQAARREQSMMVWFGNTRRKAIVPKHKYTINFQKVWREKKQKKRWLNPKCCFSLSQPTRTVTLQHSIGEKPSSAIANPPKSPKWAPTKPSQIPVSLFGTSKERQKSPPEEKKDLPARQERYGLPEQDLHQQEHPKALQTTCSYQHHWSASSMIPRWSLHLWDPQRTAV